MVLVDDGDDDEVGNDHATDFETSPLRKPKSSIKKRRRKALPATYEPG
jgi:hypothetical protein